MVHAYLFFAEVYANDVTEGADEFREDETIHSRATPKFDNFTSGQFIRCNQTTAKIPSKNATKLSKTILNG